jgi:DNA-binding XRE family transcriptional regulator
MKRRKLREPARYWEGWKLRDWRERHEVPFDHVRERLQVSKATLYRIEAGYPPPLDTANRICALTRGAIRYRDLYHSFNPEYA